MKKLLSFILVFVMVLLMAVAVSAATQDITIHYELFCNGESEVTVKKGDVITVSYEISADANASAFTTQNEILYDHTYFELVSGSNKLSDKYSKYYATSTPVAGDGKHYVFFNSSDTLTYTASPAAIGSFQLKVIASSGKTTVKNTNFFANDSSLNHYGAAASDLVVTVEGGGGTGDGGGTGEGGGGVTGGGEVAGEEQITVPIEDSKNSPQIVVTVTDNKVQMEEITPEQLEAVEDKSAISIDLTVLDMPVESVSMPIETFSNIIEAKVESVEIKLSAASVVIDAATLTAVQEQAKGEDLVLELVKDDQAKETMTSEQKAVVSKMTNPVVIDAYFVSGGERIGDFKGGKVKITVEYDAKGLCRVWFVANSGEKTYVPSTFDGKYVSFDVNHFSHYVIESVEGCSFVDIKASDYFYNPVLWAVANGVTGGADPTHFNPDGITNRAQMVTFLWNLAGKPEPTLTKCAFTDVAPTKYYYKAVLWAVENKITAGVSATKFDPDKQLNRAQCVTFLWNYSGAIPFANMTANGPAPSPFEDVSTSAYYYNAVLWAKAQGITAGTSASRFSPDNLCTRAQVVTFIYNMKK